MHQIKVTFAKEFYSHEQFFIMQDYQNKKIGVYLIPNIEDIWSRCLFILAVQEQIFPKGHL